MASMFPDAAAAGGSAPPAEDSSDKGAYVELSGFMNNKESYAKNEASAFPMTNLFIGDTRLGCKSDADEQLILHIAFQDFVKVSMILRCLVLSCRPLRANHDTEALDRKDGRRCG